MERTTNPSGGLDAGSEPQQKVVQAGAMTRSWLRLLTSDDSGEIELRRGNDKVKIIVDIDGLARLASG